jgi:hypothetical protein
MHQVTTPREEQWLLTAVTSTGDAALAVEILELWPELSSWDRRWQVVR